MQTPVAVKVDYEHNSTAWMTGDIFHEWIHRFNNTIRACAKDENGKERHAYVLMDDHAAHTMPSQGGEAAM